MAPSQWKSFEDGLAPYKCDRCKEPHSIIIDPHSQVIEEDELVPVLIKKAYVRQIGPHDGDLWVHLCDACYPHRATFRRQELRSYGYSTGVDEVSDD